MVLADQLKAAGVVGAGGAGFPTHIKAAAQAEIVLANGAECEPLLHKDVELMKHYPEQIVAGMRRMIAATGAQRGKFGVKAKNAPAVEAVKPYLENTPIDMVLLGDFYPSGDEYELVHIATGRLIPPAGIPLHVGCVVNNVETLYNAELAAQGTPVTRKFLSVSGAVREPKSFWVPVGTSFRDLIERAGGATVEDFGIFVSGLMMGSLTFDLDDVVTKTTGGLILLPREHYLVQRKVQPLTSMNRIGRSACDQCSYCTEFCPRYLMGYEVQPHKVMRSLGFSHGGPEMWNQWAELCCACGLCTLYACPEDLFPKEACDQAKQHMREQSVKFVQQKPVQVHPMKDSRRVPLYMLRRRLKVDEYENDTPFDPAEHRPARVRLKLRQHAGKPARAVVSEGQRVEAGQLAAAAEEGVSANIHASIGGTVRRVSDLSIEIEA